MHRLVLAALAGLIVPQLAVAQQTGRTFPTGLQFATEADLRRVPPGSIPLMGVLPSTVDLSSGFPEAGSQGQQGSCVGWAVGYGVKSYQEQLERGWGWTDATKFSAAYVYNHVKEAGDCDSGAHFIRALDFVKRDGVAGSDAFAYNPHSCDRLATDAERQAARVFRIADYASVNPADEFEMKAQLASGRPVLIGMKVDQAFMDLGDAVYQGLEGPAKGAHAMVVVGYDDALGAYKVLNSWGQDWGAGGFGWISYPTFAEHVRVVREAYVMVDEAATPALPPPPTGPFTSAAGPVRSILVRFRRPVGVGTRSESRVTGDHHCASRCEGEPTRTAYSLTLTASPGRYLRHPRLTCEGDACPWSSVSFVRLRDNGTVAEAGWNVWGHKTTWRLEAEEFELQEYKQERRQVRAGDTLRVSTDEGDAAPVVAVTLQGREFRVSPTTAAPEALLYYVGREERAGSPVHTFQVQKP